MYQEELVTRDQKTQRKKKNLKYIGASLINRKDFPEEVQSALRSERSLGLGLLNIQEKKQHKKWSQVNLSYLRNKERPVLSTAETLGKEMMQNQDGEVDSGQIREDL